VSADILSIFRLAKGDIVHKGDLLFQIDPRPYQHAYEQAVGQLQQAKANQQLQEVTFTRQQRLRDTGVIAKEDLAGEGRWEVGASTNSDSDLPGGVSRERMKSESSHSF
jgi:Biotin-lipoyl like